MAQTRSVMKSFRMNGDLTDSLSKIARRLNITESSFINREISNALKIDPLFLCYDGIRLTTSQFARLISNIDESNFAKIGLETAEETTTFELQLFGRKTTFSSLNWFILEILQNLGWFRAERFVLGTSYELKLFHNFGPNWSALMRSYFSSAYKKLGEGQPEIIGTEKFVNLSFPRFAD